MERRYTALATLVAAATVMAAGPATGDSGGGRTELQPRTFPRIGKVDPRFQSFNVESVEVTGGNFWAPYPKPGQAAAKPAVGPHGTEFATNAYEKREPIDLTGNRRLRTLAKALAPSYMRVSGSWANSIYFQDDDRPAAPPPRAIRAS